MDKETEKESGGRNKIGFRIIKQPPIATASSKRSNPPGFTPSGVLMHGIISQHAVWTPGNDNYQLQLCTFVLTCSYQMQPLDVSHVPWMVFIFKGKWTWRSRWVEKWNECILLGPLGDSISYFTVFNVICRWKYVACTWLFKHFNRCYFHSNSHLFILSLSLSTILQNLCYVSLNNVWSVQIWSWVVIRQDMNNILRLVRKENWGRMKDCRDYEEHGPVSSPVCVFLCEYSKGDTWLREAVCWGFLGTKGTYAQIKINWWNSS